MGIINLLYKREYQINDKIWVRIPTVGEILDDEDNYYAIVSTITAMPIDMMLALDSVGIDFTTIDSYELFLLMSETLKGKDMSLIFKDLDLNGFEMAINEKNNMPVLINKDKDIVIDRLIYEKITSVLRKIHHMEKDTRKPGNEAAKKFMLERARTKAKRNSKRSRSSQLEPLIVAMVNAEQYKYNFEGTRELSIYQFMECVQQIIKKVNYDNTMHGVYAGTINAKELSQDDLNWLIHK